MKNSIVPILLFCSFFSFASPFASPFSPSAEAQTNVSIVMSATQHSGYTTAEAAFENHCELDSTGHATGYLDSGWTGSGWTTSKPFSFQLTSRALQKLKQAISSSKAGPFQNQPAQCDAGTVELSATADGDAQSFFVIQSPDCAPGVLNLNPVAQDLRVWVANLCDIKY